jgi:hypothetical protein
MLKRIFYQTRSFIIMTFFVFCLIVKWFIIWMLRAFSENEISLLVLNSWFIYSFHFSLNNTGLTDVLLEILANICKHLPLLRCVSKILIKIMNIVCRFYVHFSTMFYLTSLGVSHLMVILCISNVTDYFWVKTARTLKRLSVGYLKANDWKIFDNKNDF